MTGEFVKHHEISDRIRDGDRTDVMACLLIEWVGDLGELDISDGTWRWHHTSDDLAIPKVVKWW